MNVVPRFAARVAASLGAVALAAFLLPASAVSQKLVLWNSLDDFEAVENSIVGPGLTVYPLGPMGEFVSGVVGKGLTQKLQPYPDGENFSVYLTGLDEVVNADRGTLEIWMKLDKLPVAGVRDKFQIFGNPGPHAFGSFHLWVEDTHGQPRIQWYMFPTPFPHCAVRSLADGEFGYPVADLLGRWVKINALWDRDGVVGSLKRHAPLYVMELYLDNQLVAASDDPGWLDGFGPAVALGGGLGDIGEAFVLDELKIWNSARAPRPEPQFFPIGPGCSGSAGVPVLDAAPGEMPWMGAAFTMRLSSLPIQRNCVAFGIIGTSVTETLGFPLPIDLGLIGMPGCNLYVSVDTDFVLGNHVGFVDWTVFVPQNISLIGASFYAQGAVLDPPANPFGMTVSNAAEARVGTR